MQCWNCGKELSIFGKISFRASCETCFADLHVCKNCTFYQPGRLNDCMIPGTEYVADRTKNNLCEEFKPLGKHTPNRSSEDAKKRFDDLFKD